jgi:hypothetical protein
MIILAFAASLMAADYSGVWNGTGGIESVKYGSVPQTAQMTLQQAGSSVTGSLKLGNALVVAITSGTVSGTNITFAAGTAFTANLTANGSQLTGKVYTSRGEVMDVVFTQQH